MLSLSHRLTALPEYAAAEMVAAKRRLLARGVDVIDLGAGDADFPPPPVAVEALQRALADSKMSRYGFQFGLLAYREAICRYMARRFGLELDPVAEVLPLIGSKEGLAHLALAVLDPGDRCVVPEPGYTPYAGGVVLAGGRAVVCPLSAENSFLVELDQLPEAELARIRLLYLNYPNNPTTAIAPRDYLERTVALCRERGIVLAYDNPYCELTFDGYRAPSIFEIPGAREVAVEFHSLSKSFGLTGWRLGWAAGPKPLIEALARIKTFVDTGPFLAVQAAGAAVLDDAERIIAPIVDQFTRRRDAAVSALGEAGFRVEPPRATMYLWVPLPEGVRSAPFAWELVEAEGLLVLHGSNFGQAGEGFFRIALTVPPERLREAVSRISRSGALGKVGSVAAP